MITLIFTILLIGLVIKLVALALKATWGITKVVLTVIVFPVVLVVLAVSGLMVIAFPLLIVGGIIALVTRVAA